MRWLEIGVVTAEENGVERGRFTNFVKAPTPNKPTVVDFLKPLGIRSRHLIKGRMENLLLKTPGLFVDSGTRHRCADTS